MADTDPARATLAPSPSNMPLTNTSNASRQGSASGDFSLQICFGSLLLDERACSFLLMDEPAGSALIFLSISEGRLPHDLNLPGLLAGAPVSARSEALSSTGGSSRLARMCAVLVAPGMTARPRFSAHRSSLASCLGVDEPAPADVDRLLLARSPRAAYEHQIQVAHAQLSKRLVDAGKRGRAILDLCGVYLGREPHFCRGILAEGGAQSREPSHSAIAKSLWFPYICAVSISRPPSRRHSVVDLVNVCPFAGFRQHVPKPMCDEWH